MQLPENLDDLMASANQLKLYKNLIQQLNKDLLLANIDASYHDEILPTSLKLMLRDIVFNLIQSNFSEYLNLLYIIDVSEAKIKALDGNDTTELSEQVTFLILQREFQKVWYRNRY